MDYPNIDKTCSYATSVVTNDNIKIPVLANGKVMFSKYNPHRDYENFATMAIESLHKSPIGFLIIAGLGNAEHIKKIREKSKCFILVIEKNDETINFLRHEYNFTWLDNDKDIKITTIKDLYISIINLYLPALFGDFSFMAHRVWFDYHINYHDYIAQTINNTLTQIKNDYSVQSHFGKIWFHNFFSNLYFFFSTKNRKNREQLLSSTDLDFKITAKIKDTKIAAIIAAGPSLDESIKKIMSNRDKYYIIATDTAFYSLSNYKIKCDAVVSIDAQWLSSNHFLNEIDSNTLYIADICSNPSAFRKMAYNDCKIVITSSNYPLSRLCEVFTKKSITNNFFLYLDPGTGTVTASAVDFAKTMNFKYIELFGADFEYKEGKPYAKGTYLDAIYTIQANKLNTLEKQYSALMYRTPLISRNKKNCYTTEILSAYKKSVENILISKKETPHFLFPQNFTFENFLFQYDKALNNFEKNTENESVKDLIFLTTLPLAAWGRLHGHLSDNCNRKKILQLSKSFIEDLLICDKTDF